MRKLRAVLAGASVLAVVTAGLPTYRAEATVAAPTSHSYAAAQVVQFNIFGGNGNAFLGYNTTVAPAIENSILARGAYMPFTVSLNEVCENQYNHMTFVLNANGRGYSSSNPWGYSYTNMLSLGDFFGHRIGTQNLHTDCGSWYGNALFMRGSFTGGGADWYPSNHQEPQQSGELRNWICKEVGGGGSVSCGTHLENDHGTYTFLQAGDFRAVANLVSGDGAWALGDLNYGVPGGNLDRLAWIGDGFGEADGCCASHSTTNGGAHYDYIWRKNNGSYPHAVYIFNSAHSDHHWYQAYM